MRVHILMFKGIILKQASQTARSIKNTVMQYNAIVGDNVRMQRQVLHCLTQRKFVKIHQPIMFAHFCDVMAEANFNIGVSQELF